MRKYFCYICIYLTSIYEAHFDKQGLVNIKLMFISKYKPAWCPKASS